jgi:hypothetical protein
MEILERGSLPHHAPRFVGVALRLDVLSLVFETPAFYRQPADLELGQAYFLTQPIGGVTDQIRKTCETRADEFDPCCVALRCASEFECGIFAIVSIREARGNERSRRKGRTVASEGMKVFIVKS